ncbi:hypothetical protein HYW42_02450 [Candidatus Daviesbacteria bacterium]|nr:hypothetical protein [Candidatus Daviesbacteria bacterium]
MAGKLFNPTVVLFLVSLLNFWVWRIFQGNIFLGVILLFLTFILFRLYQDKKGKLLIALLISIVLVSLFVLGEGWDKTIFAKSPAQVLLQDRRHGYLADNLGKAFTNKASQIFYARFSTPIYKMQENVFSTLDLNLYFFASHPRERAGIDDFEKYSFVFLPVFLIGFVKLLSEKKKIVIYYFLLALVVSAFISSKYRFGPVFFFPLINLAITIGFLYLVNFFRTKLKYEI